MILFFVVVFVDWVGKEKEEEELKRTKKSLAAATVTVTSLEFIALLIDLSATLASASLASGLSEGVQRGESGTLEQVASSVPVIHNLINK